MLISRRREKNSNSQTLREEWGGRKGGYRDWEC